MTSNRGETGAFLRNLVNAAASLRATGLDEQLHEFWLLGVGGINALVAHQLTNDEDGTRWLESFANLCGEDFAAQPGLQAAGVGGLPVAERLTPTDSATAEMTQVAAATREAVTLARLERVVIVDSGLERRSEGGVGLSSIELYDDAVLVRWTLAPVTRSRSVGPGRPAAVSHDPPGLIVSDDLQTPYLLVANNTLEWPGETLRGEAVFVPRRRRASELEVSCEGTSWSVQAH